MQLKYWESAEVILPAIKMFKNASLLGYSNFVFIFLFTIIYYYIYIFRKYMQGFLNKVN